MKALVISGGGNKGAFAGGIAEYLLHDKMRNYDLFLGTSTGSLLISHLAIGKVEKIKQVFTNVTQSTIFSSSPFILINEESGLTRTKINHFNIVRMFMRGKKTLGESENLRKMIRNSLSRSDFSLLRDSGKEVIATVANLTQHTVEYKSSKSYNYDEYCDWLWISANLVPYMSLVVKNGHEYADGGFGNFVPLKKAIEMGATEIDAIILRTDRRVVDHLPAKNVLDLFLKLFGFMINQIALDDIDLARMAGKSSKIKINFYFIPNELDRQSIDLQTQADDPMVG